MLGDSGRGSHLFEAGHDCFVSFSGISRDKFINFGLIMYLFFFTSGLHSEETVTVIFARDLSNLLISVELPERLGDETAVVVELGLHHRCQPSKRVSSETPERVGRGHKPEVFNCKQLDQYKGVEYRVGHHS